jgi:hypothetical protein
MASVNLSSREIVLMKGSNPVRVVLDRTQTLEHLRLIKLFHQAMFEYYRNVSNMYTVGKRKARREDDKRLVPPRHYSGLASQYKWKASEYMQKMISNILSAEGLTLSKDDDFVKKVVSKKVNDIRIENYSNRQCNTKADFKRVEDLMVGIVDSLGVSSL